MRTLCGIDEAGYGPPLGPLVMSAAIFESEREEGEAVRAALRRVAGDAPSRARGRPVVCDSKLLCTGARGVERLERNLMPFVAVLPRGSVSFFGEAAAPGGGVEGYPWYAGQALDLPLCGDAEGIERDSVRLREELADAGVRFADLWFQALHPVEFNAAVRRTDNKALVLARILGRYLPRLWDRAERGPADVWIDKLGGRNRYAPLLAGLLPDAWIAPQAEGPDRSVYDVQGGGRRMTVRFVRKGESRHPAVALASMCSKYVRELFMARFNAWWCARVPDLAPTKGYATDAGRFLNEIEPCRRREGVPVELLVRCR